MLPELIDTHCHLDVAAFDPDRHDVVVRAREAGVRHIIVPAIARSGWEKLEGICRVDGGLHAAYGLHPVFLHDHLDSDIDALEQRLALGGAIAVGECGLDHVIPTLDRGHQQRLFEAQLALARQFDLPVIVHARRAVDAVIACIRRVGRLRGVIHSYGGSVEQACELHRHDFMIGIGGPYTWPRSRRLHRVLREAPLDQLLLETDAPDQSDEGWRGKRNEPSRTSVIARSVARIRNMDEGELAVMTANNARRLFVLPASTA
ncbi:MAG: TatD family hydrolase [Xanthomonadales bacterium]|nr:TatD family hydrolase [Xanthomonadales bacterium]